MKKAGKGFSLEENISANLGKYRSRNALKRLLVKRFNLRVAEVIEKLGPQVVLDAGCGQGFVLSELSARYPAVQFCGVDKSDQALKYARRLVPAIPLASGDVTNLPFKDGLFDLVICFAVLPYVQDASAALRELGRVSNDHLLLAVPNEPWFRLANVLSLRYLRSLGSVGFVHDWSREAFAELVSQQFTILKVMTPFPWTLVLARSRMRR